MVFLVNIFIVLVKISISISVLLFLKGFVISSDVVNYEKILDNV